MTDERLLVTTRIRRDIVDCLDDYANRRERSRSDVIRDLIYEGLGRLGYDVPTVAPLAPADLYYPPTE